MSSATWTMPDDNADSASRPFSPAPAGERWLDKLTRCASAAALREALATRHAGFVSGTLQRLAILGAGPEGRRLVELCAGQGIEITALCDDNADIEGVEVCGLRVRPTTVLGKIDLTVPVVVASHRVLAAMSRLRGAGFEHVAPFAILQVLEPERFPPHMFYDCLLEDLYDNRERYAGLHDMLADEESRRVLDAVIGFRLTLDPELLRPVIDTNLYAPAGLFNLGGDEVYVDAGAYDGDSVRWFVERSKNRFSRVLAFEPDPATYVRLKSNFADDARIETFNQGLHAKASVLRFDDAGARGSAIVDDGSADISVVALDEVLDDGLVTFVKMNIEGAELDAIRGAQGSIVRWAPRLAISAYHRPSDLWRVPELIREVRPDYKLYMRQHDGGIIETVAYAL